MSSSYDRSEFVARLEQTKLAATRIDHAIEDLAVDLKILSGFDSARLSSISLGLAMRYEARPVAMRETADRIVELRKALRDATQIAVTIETNMRAALKEVAG